MEGALLSPHTEITMIHVFRIIIWQSNSREHPYSPTGDMLSSSESWDMGTIITTKIYLIKQNHLNAYYLI